MTKALYTYIMEFRGGTYTTQVLSDSLEVSLTDWVEQLTKEQAEIEHLGTNTITAIKEATKDPDYSPVRLNGLTNVFYWHTLTEPGAVAVHIIKTCQDA